MSDSSIWIAFNCFQQLGKVYDQVLDNMPYLVFTIVNYFVPNALICRKVDQICRTKYTQCVNDNTDVDLIQSR